RVRRKLATIVSSSIAVSTQLSSLNSYMIANTLSHSSEKEMKKRSVVCEGESRKRKCRERKGNCVGDSPDIKWFQSLPIAVAGDRTAILPAKFSVNHH
ncbi:hypothetical protein L195_g021450, partial [Trifolium pratense]